MRSKSYSSQLLNLILSFLFYIISFIFTLSALVVCLPLLVTKKTSFLFLKYWAVIELWFLKICCGVSYELKNFNVPESGSLIAAKHHSVFEILILLKHVPNPVFFLKKEIMYVPLVNFFLLRTKQLVVDRTNKQNSGLLDIACDLISTSNIIIFPEGKRVKPEENTKFHAGIIFLAQKLEKKAHEKACKMNKNDQIINQFKQNIIPFAINCGVFWPKKSLIKQPGVAVVQQLPNLICDSSLSQNLANLQKVINEYSAILVANSGFYH